jgi:REP element-mobilizing transposase RayT
MREAVWKHIFDNARKKGIFIDHVGGYSDHCHCLVSLGVDQTIQKIMQLIKGESSFWINKHTGFTEILKGRKFEWQTQYFAVAVSESTVQNVRNYIKRQEQHHGKKSYQDEFEELIEKYKFQFFEDEE